MHLRGPRPGRHPIARIIALLALTFAGAVISRSSAAEPAAPRDTGRALYEYYCYQCHGYAGDGATLAARYLQPPPRKFTALRRSERSRAQMIHSVRHGRPGTGMQSFARVLDEQQSAAVVDYIRNTFMDRGRLKTGYHTAANGWPDHTRHAAAFPFATGELRIDARDLTPAQESGRRLFLSACITCHEGRGDDAAPAWAARVVSYPRNAGTCTPCHRSEVPSAMPDDARHRPAASLAAPTARQLRGRQLFVSNCAFCHAEDGSGGNWIGAFLEPHARDLTQASLRRQLTPEHLRRTILQGLPGTSMPAWRQVLSDADVEALMDYLSARHQWPRDSAPTLAVGHETRNPAPTWRRQQDAARGTAAQSRP